MALSAINHYHNHNNKPSQVITLILYKQRPFTPSRTALLLLGLLSIFLAHFLHLPIQNYWLFYLGFVLGGCLLLL